MENDEMAAFAQLMTFVCEHYKHAMNEVNLNGYWQALKKYALSAIEEAFYRHINNPDTGQFMPKIGDISRCLQGDSETQALLAWSRIEQTVRDVGSYESVVFDDLILQCVIEDMGGWIRFCGYTVQAMDFLKHEFKKRYQAYVLRPPTSYPAQLIGRFAWHNHQQGYENQPVLLIGDPQKAKQVYEQGRKQGLPNSITRFLPQLPVPKLTEPTKAFLASALINTKRT